MGRPLISEGPGCLSDTMTRYRKHSSQIGLVWYSIKYIYVSERILGLAFF